MDSKKVNRQIADTQEINTLQINSQYYTCDDYLEPWGKLNYASGEYVSLVAPKTYFGREKFRTTDPDIKSVEFDEKKLKPTLYERLSKNHFIIERAIPIDSSNKHFEPAIITCKGRNGLHIGKNTLAVGDKRILKDRDWICLPPGIKIFQFSYSHSEENAIEKTCSIHNTFYIGDILGKGACGEVRKVIKLLPVKKDNKEFVFEEYAIKCIEKPKDSLLNSKDESFKSLLNEVEIMKSVDYVHILRLFDVFESSRQIVLVFPFMKGGDLLTKILKQPTKCLNEADAKFFFAQVNLGLKYLHSKGITHRDIKAENILLSDLNDSPLLSIADFGLSKMNDIMKTQCGTELYVAPEVLKKKTIYTNAVDIWSSGVLLYAMLTGRQPFGNDHRGSLRDNILAGRFSFSPPSLWNKIPTAKNVITFMLQVNPRNRLTASELAKHKWLKDEKLAIRLNKAYSSNHVNVKNYDYDYDNDENDDSTDNIEKSLINISIHEEENPPKRQKLM